MATEVYHLARENRKKVGCHMRKKVKALPGDQGKKRKKEKGGGGATSGDRMIIKPLNSKCSSYCILILSRKYTQSYYRASGIVSNEMSPIPFIKISIIPAMVCVLASSGVAPRRCQIPHSVKSFLFQKPMI